MAIDPLEEDRKELAATNREILAIDPLEEEPLPLRDACKYFPRGANGKRPHVSQLYRYTGPGLRGVRLEWIQCGGRRCTSRQAVARFFERLTIAAGATSPSPASPGRSSDVERELQLRGL